MEDNNTEDDTRSNGDEITPVYFISLLGSDASGEKVKGGGKGLPTKAFYIFDVKSEMELEQHQVRFLSCQDLLEYYEVETGKNGESMNVYQLVIFFIKMNPNAYYFLDEVPFLKGEPLF